MAVTSTARTAARMAPAVRDLRIDQDYLREVIARLTAIGSSPLGFRTAGTEEDAAVAQLVVEEFRASGLTGVGVEGVDVDAWRFRSAGVEVRGAQPTRRFEASSFGGVPATPAAGVSGRLVDVGDGRRRRLDRLDLGGAVALLDWRHSGLEPVAAALELTRRGAAAIVLGSPAGGPWWQTPHALGAFDGNWTAAAAPLVVLRGADQAGLREDARASRDVRVTVTLDVQSQGHAVGRNVVGFVPGALPGPLIVGAHHDAWFRGAFDNTSGVAALLGLVRAVATSGHRLRHTVCFTSRTAEEFGIADSAYDWCIGAWRQVSETHPGWSASAPFHLCLEASGRPDLRTVVEAPVELRSWARAVCTVGASEGWAPTGWRLGPPVAATEQWPLLLAGVPGVAAYAWEPSFARTEYHSQLDTADRLDLDVLARQCRLDALLLMTADADPEGALDHRARSRQLAAVAERTGHPGLAAAARRRPSSARGAFVDVGRRLLALDAHDRVCYPHVQALLDADNLDAAVVALRDGDSPRALRLLRRVGRHDLAGHLSEQTATALAERLRPGRLERTWASHSHLTESPRLWPELAALAAAGTSAPPRIEASLVAARDASRAELGTRLEAMACYLQDG